MSATVDSSRKPQLVHGDVLSPRVTDGREVDGTRSGRCRSIAILGIGRVFRREPRIRHEIAALGDTVLIDGFGAESATGIRDFTCVSQPSWMLRKLFRAVGVVAPRLRMACELRYYRRLSRALASAPYELLIAHNLLDAIVARDSGKRFAFHSHEYLPRQFDGSWVFRVTQARYSREVLRCVLPLATKVVVEGERVASLYSKQFGVSDAKLFVMPSMPPYQSAGPLPPSTTCRATPSNVSLIHHGLLDECRGTSLLVKLIQELGPGFHMTLMGPTTARYRRKLRSCERKTPNLRVIDPSDPERVVESLQGYDLGVILFSRKHFHQRVTAVPNKFWECLQARVPVIVSPESAMAEIVSVNGCGVVAENGTVSGFVASLRSLNRSDLERMKSRCHNLARLHSRESWMSLMAPALGL